MNADAVNVIQSHGGCTALAKKLGLRNPQGAKRVGAWRQRGIPDQVALENPDLFPHPYAQREVSQ